MTIYQNKKIKQYSIILVALSIATMAIRLSIPSFESKVKPSFFAKAINAVEEMAIVTNGTPKQAQVTAFSAHEYCATNYAKQVHPNCNGQTFGEQTAAIKREWLNEGYTKVYIPQYDKTYRVIGATDWKTEVDIWKGDDYQGALEVGSPTLLVYLQK